MPKGAKIRAIGVNEWRTPPQREQKTLEGEMASASPQEDPKKKDTKDLQIAVTSVMFNPDDGLIYCGLTAINNDLLYTYDRKTGEFTCRNYKKIAEPFEVKIHRSLILMDGLVYGATACLHGANERLEAPGGRLFRYDPKTGEYETLGRPVPYDYIQSIAIDKKRKVVFGNNYPVNYFWSFDLKTREAKNLGLAEMPHGMFCDRDGNTWGVIADSQRLFKYNAEEGFTKFDFTLPKFNRMLMAMENLFQPTDEDTIYVGTQVGAVLALDPKKVEFTYLGKPCRDNRIHGFMQRKDGLIYGVGGEDERCEVFAYDREAKKFMVLGHMHDKQRNMDAARPHNVTITDDGVIYTGETDNPGRSGYMWEIVIED